MPPAPKPKPTHVVKLQLGKTTTTKVHHHVVVETGIAFVVDDVAHPALVPGDVEVVEAEFLDAQGNEFSSEKGVWTLVHLPNIWHAVVVHKWPKGPIGTQGDLTVQFVQDFDDPTPYRFAITGGTGDYQGAYGQIEFVSPQDITFRFSTP